MAATAAVAAYLPARRAARVDSTACVGSLTVGGFQDIHWRLRCDTCGRRNQRLLVGFDQAAVPDG